MTDLRKAQPEALRLADELDNEFTQGRISNQTGRDAAVELRRLHEENQALLKAAEMALESLELSHPRFGVATEKYKQAIKALCQALAEPANSTTNLVEPKASSQTEQEPVAWMTQSNDLLPLFHGTKASALNWLSRTYLVPLYTAPPSIEAAVLAERGGVC